MSYHSPVQVEGENMVQATHDKVVEAIKSTLKKQGESGGEASLTLKVGMGMVKRICRYLYESTDDYLTQVQASCQDSSYTYSVPAQVRLLCL